MDQLVCVKTFDKIELAEVARAVLELEGIKAAIFRDDLGGWMPGHHFSPAGIRLMVNGCDLERAGQILERPSKD